MRRSGPDKDAEDPLAFGAGRTPTRAEQQLVEAACELFDDRGFQAVGVDAITEEADVSKMTLYRVFASKDRLAAACVAHMATCQLAELETLAQRRPDDPLGQLQAILTQTIARISHQGYRGWLATTIAADIVDPGHPARRATDAYKNRIRQLFRDLALACGARQPEVLADILLLLIEGAAISRRGYGDGGAAPTLSQAIDLVLQAHGLPVSLASTPE